MNSTWQAADTGRVVTLRTPRLVLRPFTIGDTEAVLAYRNDPSVARFQGWPLPYTEAHFAQLLDPEKRRAETGWVSWCICEANTVLGDIGVKLSTDEAEVGVTLARSAQGKGYASEAIAAISAHAFGALGLRRLHAGVNPGNDSVVRLFTRAGWQHEETAEQAYWHRDHWDDEAIYTLTRPL